MYSPFDSFFSPPTIVVVSEERLQAAEREMKQRKLKDVDAKIEELNAYRDTLVKELAPAKETTDNG
tara:strand:- start:1125 stop:1322 length:198 start_codon:yes stop_codon:yes gene_type:complete